MVRVVSVPVTVMWANGATDGLDDALAVTDSAETGTEESPTVIVAVWLVGSPIALVSGVGVEIVGTVPTVIVAVAESTPAAALLTRTQ